MLITTGTLVLIRLYKKADLLEIRVNSMKGRKVYDDKIRDEWRPCAQWFKDMLIVAGRWTTFLQFAEIIKFANFNSKACLGCLNGFIVLISSYQEIYGKCLQEMLLYSCFFRSRMPHISCQSQLLSTSILLSTSYI